jgi:dihydrofolate reductase
MRPLRYSINVTLDGCCDHRAMMIAGEDLHRHAAENLAQADALLFGRVTYEMMAAAWRPARTGAKPVWMADWMVPFANAIDAAKKYVVSSTLDQVDWNAELVRGDLGNAVEQLKKEPGKGLFVGGVTGVGRARIDRRVRIRGAAHRRGPWADTIRRTIEAYRLEAREPARIQLGRGGDAVSAGQRHHFSIVVDTRFRGRA